MDDSDFRAELESLGESQGGENFLSLALSEFELEYVDDIPREHRAFFIRRVIALWEEAIL